VCLTCSYRGVCSRYNTTGVALGSTPQISVVIANLDRCALLCACLQSLEKQANADFEVIVVDNGSRDGSPDMVRSSFINRVNFPVKLVENNVNKGFCAANNQGITLARGEFVALLNNDAEAAPGWLSSLYQAIAHRPDCGMVASKILVYENRSRIDKAGHLIYPDGQNRGRGTGQTDRGQFDQLGDALWPDGCAALYRRTMLEQIGGFDEDLFAYGDDAELGLRARIDGWGCAYAPEAVVWHHRASTLGLFSSRRVELIERNRLLLAVKHFPLSLLWLNGAYSVARMAAGAWAALRGRGEAGNFPGIRGKLRIAQALLRGSVQALLLLPATLEKRRRFRPLRKLTSKQIRALLLRHRISLRELSEQTT